MTNCGTDRCPKSDLLRELERDKARILRSSEANKTFYRKMIRWLGIITLISLVETVLVLTYGRDGIGILLDLLKSIR